MRSTRSKNGLHKPLGRLSSYWRENLAMIVRLSKKRLEALINREAQRRLHMSSEEFRRRLGRNELPEGSAAVYDISMLVRLASG
jgi:hypothetical protein